VHVPELTNIQEQFMRLARQFLVTAILAASSAAAHANWLGAGGTLMLNQGIESGAKRYSLTLQGDRQLVMRRWDGTVRWTAGGTGLNAVMQSDGNFVLYGAFGATWHTNTWGNPGSYIVVQDDGNLVVYAPGGRPLWHIGVDRYTPDNPRDPGDVVGRDLDVPGLGAIGHIGVWDGSQVAEVVNGQSNAVRFSQISDFKATTSFWGVARPSIPPGPLERMCFATYCDIYNNTVWQQVEARAAIQKRARQIQALGADYTLVPSNTRIATPRRNLSAAIRGLYRCDTFVIDVVGLTRYRATYTTAAQENWRALWSSIEYGPVLPRTVYNRLASFR
jgi:hypothetical protein